VSDALWAIETVGLRKEYGPKVAVAGLDLQVARGEAFGFLGPNGAGKTTSIKMLLGLVRPTSGHATLLGHHIGDPEGRRRVGFLPEHFRFPEWMRADEFLDLHGRLLHMDPRECRKRGRELLELVGLTEAAGRQLSTFSKGMLQRVGLAQALLNDPEVVFLDEPTSGLDPLGRVLVRDIIRGLRERGTTVFLNSHLLTEVELTCTRVAIIADGRVRETRSLDAERDGHLVVDVTLEAVHEGLIAGLRRWSPQVEQHADRRTLTLHVADRTALPEIARWLVTQNANLYALTPRRKSLEELYVEYVKETE